MADDYELKEMPGIGQVLLRHKVSSPRWMMAMMVGVPLVAGVVSGAALGLVGLLVPGLIAFGVGAGLSLLFTVLNVTFSTARVAISEGEIHIQLGFSGPRIPIAEVASVKLAPSGTNKVGMGVGNDLRGTTTYRLWGINARAVHISRRDGTKVVLVVKEPEAMVQAIEEAMSRHAKKGPRVRVEAEEEAVIEASESERAARARSGSQ